MKINRTMWRYKFSGRCFVTSCLESWKAQAYYQDLTVVKTVPIQTSNGAMFTAVNSSSHERICTICENSAGHNFSWTGCMNNLDRFHFQHSKLTVVRHDLFPLPMPKLIEVDLSYNQISKIGTKAFHNAPVLKVLNLSHNALKSLGAIFEGQKMGTLEQLDLSWNMIKSLGSNVFPQAPSLKVLKIDNNNIVFLEQGEWQNAGDALRVIDLRANRLHCDCNIRWINDTFPKNVIQGTCTTPKDYENRPLRFASILLNKQCDEDGNIITKQVSKRIASTTTSTL